ncbi:MAG: hypothetical protein QM802_18170 [Agriterribacter sp.]
MTILIIVLIATALAIFSYVLSQYLLFRKLKQKLDTQNREVFVKELGEKYKIRPINYDLHRYKWLKGIFIVRANFDDKGNLVGSKTISRRKVFGRNHAPSNN